VVERFAEDSELQDEIRLLGGIPLVLALLRSVLAQLVLPIGGDSFPGHP